MTLAFISFMVPCTDFLMHQERFLFQYSRTQLIKTDIAVLVAENIKTDKQQWPLHTHTHTKKKVVKDSINISKAGQKMATKHTNSCITLVSYPLSESRYWNFWSFLLITAKHQCISLWMGTNICEKTTLDINGTSVKLHARARKRVKN